MSNTTLPYPTVDISEVFGKYFAKEPPFGENQKKDEFPDAFTLLILEKWCQENGNKCHILSKDGDMKGYASPYLIAVQSYESFLDELLRDIQENKEVIGKSLLYFASHEEQAAEPIRNWLLENLDNDTKYDDVVNYMEVLDIDIEKHEVKFSTPEIISTAGIYGSVEMEVPAELHYIVKLEIPDESMGWYDDEEREWHYMETKTITIEHVESIKVLVSIDVSVEDGIVEAEGLDVTEINGGKDLIIRDKDFYRNYRFK